MAASSRVELLNLLRKIPIGRVTSAERIAAELGISSALVVTMMGGLSEDERDLVPWHRVVAKGGAIGRGPHRDRQFARLVREGVTVSPAGIVQDLDRHMLSIFESEFPPRETQSDAPRAGGRSRGMKDRP